MIRAADVYLTCVAAAEHWQYESMDYPSFPQGEQGRLATACEELLRTREASGDDGFVSVVFSANYPWGTAGRVLRPVGRVGSWHGPGGRRRPQ